MDDKKLAEGRDGASPGPHLAQRPDMNLNAASPRGVTFDKVMPALRNGYWVGRLSSGVEIFLARATSLSYAGTDNNVRTIYLGDQLMMKFRDKYMPVTLESFDLVAEDWFVMDKPLGHPHF